MKIIARLLRDSKLTVAEALDGEVVGWCATEKGGDRLYYAYVKQRSRNLGVCRMMLQHAIGRHDKVEALCYGVPWFLRKARQEWGWHFSPFWPYLTEL